MREKQSNPDDLNINRPKKDEIKFEVEHLHSHERKMIRGFMSGFGKIMILWLISKKKQYGYEIMTKLHESSPYDSKMPSASMIYPVLHYLEKKRLIKGTWEYQGKRKVKYYEITKKGTETLSRIKKTADIGRKLGKTDIWRDFMADMFSIKRK